MRPPTSYLQDRSDPDTAMTPMIDVVFLLLVFFLWTASFQIAERVLPSQLSAQQGTQPADPNQPPPPEDDFDDVVVRIQQNAGGLAWSVNDQPVDGIEAVFLRLQQLAQIRIDTPVIVDPDSNVPIAPVIDIYDRSRQVGFTRVQLATSQQP